MKLIEIIKDIIDAIRTDLFYRFGIGGEKMPPDMLEVVMKHEREKKRNEYTKGKK